MEYDIKRKKINGEICLTLNEAAIFELLIEYNGVPITTENISFETGITVGSIRTHVYRINEKILGLGYIQNRHGYGYYIDEEIKIY